MKIVSQLVAAAVLLALGFACWTASAVQQRVADAHERMAMLQYGGLDAAYDAVEASLGAARPVPWLTAALLKVARVDEQRAAADYWRARYGALAQSRDENGATVARDPAVVAVAAAAAWRADQREAADKVDLQRRVDLAIRSYADLLKKRADDPDVAFNFEFLVRMREALTKGRPAPTKKAAGLVMAGDLPAGRTIHGDPGAPPADVNAGGFKMVVPKREDERGAGDKAGEGQKKERKG